jgi:hypothetical protein
MRSDEFLRLPRRNRKLNLKRLCNKFYFRVAIKKTNLGIKTNIN